MSHTTTMRGIAIRDENAIRSAVLELQGAGVPVRLEQDAVPGMYYRKGVNANADQHGKCDYVLKMEGTAGYDLGLDKQQDGTFAPVFDEWDNHVAKKLGADVNVCPMPTTPEGRAQHQIGRFLAAYAKHAAINSAQAKGYIVKGTVFDQATGQTHITIGGIA